MPLNLHPKVVGGTIGTLAVTVAEALFVQCGGAQGIASTVAPILIPVLPPAVGAVVAYFVPTGSWTPTPPTTP